MTNDFYKATLNGLILGGYTYYTLPNGFIVVPSFRITVPYYLAAAGGAFASSLVGDAIHSWILPHIPHNQKYSNTESALLSPALSGATYVGINYLMNRNIPTNRGLMMLAAEGIASDIAATYIAQNVL